MLLSGPVVSGPAHANIKPDDLQDTCEPCSIAFERGKVAGAKSTAAASGGQCPFQRSDDAL